MSRLFLLSLAICFLSVTTAEVHCYMPDGTIDDVYTVPCNSTATASACCDPRDSCTTTGLCLGASGWIYRSACTDATWTAKECPSECQTDPILRVKFSTFSPIYPCVAGAGTSSFCCGSSTSSCCDASFTLGNTGLAFKPGTDALLARLANASASATAAAAVAAARVTVTMTALPTSSADSRSGTNLSIAVGVGVGVPLGILSLGVLGFLFWRERRTHQGARAPLAPAVSSFRRPHAAAPGPPYGNIPEMGHGSGIGRLWAVHELKG